MPKRALEVQLLQLLKQILFLILQLFCHTIFNLLALLPPILFEGSSLRLWTPQTSRRCRRGQSCPRWARTSCQTRAGSQTPPGMNSTRRCWPRARENSTSQALAPQALRPRPHASTQRQLRSTSPSPSRAPPRPPTPPSLRESLHQLILHHQAPKQAAVVPCPSPPPPYSSQPEARLLPTGPDQVVGARRLRPALPPRRRRRAQATDTLAGVVSAPSRTPSSTASTPPPLLLREEEVGGSESDQSC